VKFLVTLGPFSIERYFPSCDSLANALQAMERGNDSSLPFVRSIGNGLTERRRFDDESKTGEVIQIGRGHGSGPKTAMVVGDNQPFRNKPVESFTQRTARERMFSLQYFDSQLSPWRYVAVENLLSENAKCLLRKSYGRAIGPFPILSGGGGYILILNTHDALLCTYGSASTVALYLADLTIWRSFLDVVHKSIRQLRAAIGSATVTPRPLLPDAERLQY